MRGCQGRRRTRIVAAHVLSFHKHFIFYFFLYSSTYEQQRQQRQKSNSNGTTTTTKNAADDFSVGFTAAHKMRDE